MLACLSLREFWQVRGVALSFVSISAGSARCFPFQQSINVIAGVLLGSFWVVEAAFTASLIRNLMGTGIIGTWASTAAAARLTGVSASVAFFVFSFLVSSVPSTVIGAVVFYSIQKRSVISRFEDIMI